MSNNETSGSLSLAIRTFVYQAFVHETKPPTIEQTAAAFGLTWLQTKEIFMELHQNHLFFLEPDGESIRMANPFSAIPTQFVVESNGRTYWANCAWDMLGVPAALHKDAKIRATFEDTGENTEITVQDGVVYHQGGFVHFPLPVRQWYDDLIYT